MVYNLEMAIKRKLVECEQEGFQKGVDETRIAIAKRMLQMGWSINEEKMFFKFDPVLMRRAFLQYYPQRKS